MKQELVKTTIHLPRKQKELLEKRAAKCGISQSKYISMLLKNKPVKGRPPDELWILLTVLYNIHALLLKSADKESLEAASELEQAVVSVQRIMTMPEKETSDGND